MKLAAMEGAVPKQLQPTFKKVVQRLQQVFSHFIASETTLCCQWLCVSVSLLTSTPVFSNQMCSKILHVLECLDNSTAACVNICHARPVVLSAMSVVVYLAPPYLLEDL